MITLKEVMVVSYSTSAESKDDLLYDRIALNFATVDVSYQPQKADGAKDGGPVKFGWNIRQKRKGLTPHRVPGYRVCIPIDNASGRRN